MKMQVCFLFHVILSCCGLWRYSCCWWCRVS